MKKGAVSQTAPWRHGSAAASARVMPKDKASERIHGSDAWCVAHRLPSASLSVGFQANARRRRKGRSAGGTRQGRVENYPALATSQAHGSTTEPLMCTSKWRWHAVELPVLPTRPISWPAWTVWPEPT